MRTSKFAITGLSMFAFVLTGGSAIVAIEPNSRPTTTAPADADDLTGVLEKIRKKQAIPALAAAVIRDGQLIDIAATGFRSGKKGPRVTPDDCFHLGSCTKSMTATLCAILVEQGKLKWDSKVGDVFVSLKDKINPKFQTATLEQLLCHRSGLPDDHAPDLFVFPQIMALQGDMQIQRRDLVSIVLGREPAAEPGSKYAYSNFGFTIAGAMCEAVMAEQYETLMKKYLFDPLDMKSAGFGAPGSPDKIDQPRGHTKMLTWHSPTPPGPGSDNPPNIGPAGTVHMSLADWAKYAALHLDALQGKPRLLKKDSFEKLHSDPFKQEYGFGWAMVDREWAEGRVLLHDGSNGRWYAMIVLAPNKNVALLVVTNAASDPAIEACRKAMKKLQRMYLRIVTRD